MHYWFCYCALTCSIHTKFYSQLTPTWHSRFPSSTLTAGMQPWIPWPFLPSPLLSRPYRKGLGTKLCTQPFRVGVHYYMQTVKHLSVTKPKECYQRGFWGSIKELLFIVKSVSFSEELFGWHFYHNYATKELLQGDRCTGHFNRRSFSITLQIESYDTSHIGCITYFVCIFHSETTN